MFQYPDMSVRQSAYALVGDCAISIFPTLQPYLPTILPELVNQIETEPKAEAISVCNNAAWAAGEIALKFGASRNGVNAADGAGAGMQPFVEPLMAKLVPILLHPKALRSLNENSAVTIGRLGLVCPDVVAPHLDVFVTSWCGALAEIKDNDEKDSAFRGICMVIKSNPNGLAKVRRDLLALLTFRRCHTSSTPSGDGRGRLLSWTTCSGRCVVARKVLG